jgi:hypothetical protein
MKSLLRLLLAACGVLCVGGSARADTYYMLLFAHQSPVINWPSTSHTWSVFVRVDDTGRIVETHGINWFAADFTLNFFGPAEKGVNRDYSETIATAINKGYRVSLYGPFAIDAELFRRARAQEGLLESGAREYKLLDLGFRPGSPNCMHAVTDLEYDRPYTRTLFARGDRGTLKVARHLERWILPDNALREYRTYPGIARQLGVDDPRIVKRQLSKGVR